MRLPGDFRTAQAAGEGNSRIPAGGYVCKIVNAKCEEAQTGEKLVLALDVFEGEYKGFFQKLYETKKSSDAEAKWPCKYGQFTTTKEGNTNRFFKAIINSVEKSNLGYDFAATNGNEKTLIGKLVGVIFGEEEFIGNNGNVYTSCKPQSFRSVETIRSGEYTVPDKKTAANAPIRPVGSSQMQEVTDDELPF